MKNYNFPDDSGHFAEYGGVFIAETLITAVNELKNAYQKYKNDKDFVAEFEH
ncbi:MAG: tryptophan synthase subunit beta, partial [Candidatus Thioglobus sp.]|nr:tryptophan synthase subunit beta [Candidatus Thioglobus sp.]